MRIIVLTPVRLLGDGLEACFQRRDDITVVSVVADLHALRATMESTSPDLALIDVTQGVDLYDVRSIAVEYPRVALVALGLTEQRQEVIRCGRAGFAGYVSREASIDALCKSVADVVEGRLACSPEISGGLLRALFRMGALPDETPHDAALTRREGDVLQLIGQGMSNKEIARELYLSVATVKHHVHNILDKLHLAGRAQAMRRVRDAPWIAPRAERPERMGIDEK